MKIKNESDLLIIYLYNKNLNLDENDILIKDIKDLLRSLVNSYQIELKGIYDVIIYENIYYGYILEIKRIKDFDYSDYIDIKLKINRNVDFYLEFQDYFLVKDKTLVFYKNNHFYVNIKEFNNVNNIIEFCEVIYKVNAIDFSECVNIKCKNVN